ncbi:substrate-binding domain-containing protein [uncultured Ruthenibacterium sp.]|uniref:substrate-binding domain-containing protein n=1 Tax=uncultured Ruthenibacterium sp. TaxID=1905347 RepID=UPI00349E9626
MKSKHRLWQMILLALLGAATIFSLVIPERFLEGAKPQRVEVSILTRHTDSMLWATARQGMEQAAEDCGAELRFLSLSKDNDSEGQIELLQREAEVGVDAAVVDPADCEQISSFISDGFHLPVITLESSVEKAAGSVYPANAQVGQLLANQIAYDFPQGGKVLLVNGSPNVSGTVERLEKAQKILASNGFEIIVSSGFPSENQLETADIVLCFEAKVLDLIVQQTVENELSAKIYGAGVTDSAVAQLERGQIMALAAWSEYAAGYMAVTQAVAAARNEPVEDYELPVSVVREGDTYDSNHQKLLYPLNR